MIIPGTTLNRNGPPKVGFAVRLQFDEDSATATIVEITFHYPSDKPTPIFPGKSWDDLLSIHCPTLLLEKLEEEQFNSVFRQLHGDSLDQWLGRFQTEENNYGITSSMIMSVIQSHVERAHILVGQKPESAIASTQSDARTPAGTELTSALVDPSVHTYSRLTQAETVPHSVEKAVYKDQQGTINIRGSDWKIHFVWYQEVNADNGETVPSDHFDLSIVRVGNQGEQVVFRGNSIADNRTALETELNTWISEEYSIVLLNESLKDSLNESNTPAYRGDALEREQDRMSTAETLREMTLKLQESAQPSGTWEAEWIWTVYFTGWHNKKERK